MATNISRSEAKDFLASYNQCGFTALTSATGVQMNKYDAYFIQDPATGKKRKNPAAILNPFYEEGITKIARKANLITGFDYEQSVINRLLKEGKVDEANSFVGGDCWFRILSMSLVTDKATGSKFYLRYQYLDNSTREKHYEFNGNAIDRAMFQAFEQTPKNYERQGLDNPLKFQVCDLNNILELKIAKEHFILHD